ncbi:MAG: hypothetical protein ACT4TC_17415 [Myxococcaceae bacterium]
MLADDEKARTALCGRIELFLWKFLRLKASDAHRFFASVEPIEAMELVKERFVVGKVFHFFSERQDDAEWENSMTVGLCLVFAAMRQAQARGFDPKRAGIFTLQRMLEQALDGVEDLEDLLKVGAPP